MVHARESFPSCTRSCHPREVWRMRAGKPIQRVSRRQPAKHPRTARDVSVRNARLSWARSILRGQSHAREEVLDVLRAEAANGEDDTRSERVASDEEPRD